MEQSHIDKLTNETFNRVRCSFYLSEQKPDEIIFYIKKYIKSNKRVPYNAEHLADFISDVKRINSLNNFPMFEFLKSAYIFCDGDKKAICKYLLNIAEEEVPWPSELDTIIAICTHYLQNELSITNEQLNLLYSKAFDENFIKVKIREFVSPFLDLYYSDNCVDSSFNIDDSPDIEKFRIYTKDSIGILIFSNEIYKILRESIENIINEFFKIKSETIQNLLNNKWREIKHQEEQKMSKKDLILTKEDIEMLSKII